MTKLVKVTLILMMATLSSKVLGFLRDIALGSVFGATVYTDAYIIALTFPNVIFDVFVQSIGIMLVPLLLEARESHRGIDTIYFLNNVLNIVLVISMAVCAVGMVFAEGLVKVIAVGFDNHTYKMAARLTRIIFPAVTALGLSYVMTAFLQSKDSFIIPSLVGIPTNLIIITSIICSRYHGIEALATGTLIGITAQLLVQLPYAYSKGYRYVWKLDIFQRNTRRLLLLVSPVFWGIAVKKINTIIDRMLASTLAEGSISALNYAHKIDIFVFGVFSLSISSVFYKRFSEIAAQNDNTGFKLLLDKVLNTTILMLVPISVIMMVLSKPIVKLLFQRGMFDYNATQLTSSALFFYSMGIAGYGLRELLTRAFYSLKDSRTPMINGVLAVGLNILLNFILIKHMGHCGLALATSISVSVATILLYFSLKTKLGTYCIKKVLRVFVKVVVSSAAMGWVVNKFYYTLSSNLPGGFFSELLMFATSFTAGGVIYLALIVLLKVDEASIALNVIKRDVFKRQ